MAFVFPTSSLARRPTLPPCISCFAWCGSANQEDEELLSTAGAPNVSTQVEGTNFHTPKSSVRSVLSSFIRPMRVSYSWRRWLRKKRNRPDIVTATATMKEEAKKDKCQQGVDYEARGRSRRSLSKSLSGAEYTTQTRKSAQLNVLLLFLLLFFLVVVSAPKLFLPSSVFSRRFRPLTSYTHFERLQQERKRSKSSFLSSFLVS